MTHRTTALPICLSLALDQYVELPTNTTHLEVPLIHYLSGNNYQPLLFQVQDFIVILEYSVPLFIFIQLVFKD